MPTPEELQAMLASPMEGAEGPPPDDHALLQEQLAMPMDAPPEKAAAPSGPTYADDGKIYVRSKFGDLGTVDAGDAQSILDAGGRLASEDEVAGAIEEEKYTTTGQQIATGLEGAAEGATLNAYGYVASKVDEDYAKDLRKRKEYNPGIHTVGEIGGAVLPAVLSGGETAIAQGMKVLPSAIEANLAMKAATALGTQAAAKWAGSKTAQVGARVLAGALEGGLDNATRQTLDDMSNPEGMEVTAERMANHFIEGALTGGGLELGMAGVGAAVRGAAKGVKGLASKFGKADVPEGVLDDVAEAAVPPQAAPGRPRQEIDADLELAEQRIAEADSLGDPMAVQEAEDAANALRAERDNAVVKDNGLASDADLELALQVENPEQAAGAWEQFKQKLNKVKNAKELAQKFDDSANELTTSITNRLDDLQRLKQNELDRYLNRSNKPKAIKAALEQEGVVWSPEQANRILSENEQMLSVIDELKKDYALGDEVARRKLGPLKNAKEAIEGVQKHLTNIKGQGPISPDSRVLRGSLEDVAAVFWAEDNLKSYLGQLAKKKGEAMTQAEATLQRIYMKKRAALQDPRLYGNSLAEMQTVTNAIESKAIPAGRIFHNQFGRAKGLLGEHAGEFGFDELMEMDPGKIKALIKNLGESDSYKDETDFIRGLTRNIDLAEAKAKYYPVPEKTLQRISEARQTVNAIIEDVRAAKVLKVQKDEAERLARGNEGIEQIKMAMDALGAFVPGVHLVGRVGGALGAAVKLGTQGAEAGPKGRLGQLTDEAVKTQMSVNKAAESAVKNFVVGAKKKPFREVGVISGNAIRRFISSSEALQDPESEESKKLSLNIQEVANEDPGLAEALQGQVMSRASFMADKMGPSVDPDDPLGKAPRMRDPVSQRKLDQFARAAIDPIKAINRLAHGQGSAQDREAVQALAPKLYDQFVGQVFEEIKASNRPLTSAEKTRLNYMLGIPVDRSQTPEYVAFFQSLNAYQPQIPMVGPQKQPQPKGGTVDLDKKGGNTSDDILDVGDA